MTPTQQPVMTLEETNEPKFCPRCKAKLPYHTQECGPWMDGKTADAPQPSPKEQP